MGSRYQRQMGSSRSSKPNIYGPSSASDPSADEARADRARKLRRQRLANLRAENAALDARFGYAEYDSAAVRAMRDEIERVERRGRLADQVEGEARERLAGEDGKGDGSGVNDGAPPGRDAMASLTRSDRNSGIEDHELNFPGSSGSRRGWVFNMIPTTLTASGRPASSNDDGPARQWDESAGGFVGGGSEDGGGDGPDGAERSAVELFCVDADDRRFKCTVVHEPYFYVVPEDKTSDNLIGHGNAEQRREDDAQDLQGAYQELLAALTRNYQPLGLKSVVVERRMDLDSPNHLGRRSTALGGRPVLKLTFDNVDQSSRVRREVQEVLKKNARRREDRGDGYDFATYDAHYDASSAAVTAAAADPMDCLIDVREHDVPYIVRASIDLGLRAGCWYTMTPVPTGGVTLSDRDNLKKGNPSVLAFDIECTKAPLKFPDAEVDSIFMISYMVDGQGYLLLSRHVVGRDVANFEYTPKPKYPGEFPSPRQVFCFQRRVPRPGLLPRAHLRLDLLTPFFLVHVPSLAPDSMKLLRTIARLFRQNEK